jgi:hypothetical protein
MKNKITIVIATVLVTLLLSSCRNSFFKSMIIDSSCSFPCWYEITPGLTSYDKSIIILKSIPFIEKNSFQNKIYEDFSKTISWSSRGFAFTANGGYIYYHDDIVSSIELDPGANNSITLENALRYFGVPDNVIVILSNSERRYIFTIIIYLDGVALVTENKIVNLDEKSPGYTLQKSTKLSSIIYFYPENMSDVGEIVFNLPYDELLKGFIVWIFQFRRYNY